MAAANDIGAGRNRKRRPEGNGTAQLDTSTLGKTDNSPKREPSQPSPRPIGKLVAEWIDL